jgi:hypothetical protein
MEARRPEEEFHAFAFITLLASSAQAAYVATLKGGGGSNVTVSSRLRRAVLPFCRRADTFAGGIQTECRLGLGLANIVALAQKLRWTLDFIDTKYGERSSSYQQQLDEMTSRAPFILEA